MKARVILLTIPASLTTDADRALASSVVAYATRAGEIVDVVETEAQVAAILRQHVEPTALVILPGVETPVTLARRVYHQATDTYVVFVVRQAAEAKLRRDLTYAGLPGSNWSIAHADSDSLFDTVAKAARTLTQQRRLRTTLDRLNVRLSAPAPADSQRYRRLLVSDRYLASILANAQDAIISLDTRGTVVSWNTGAECLFETSERNAIGHPLAYLLAKVPTLPETIRKAASGKPVRQEFVLPAPHGDKFFDATFTPIRDDSDRTIGIAAIVRDISKRTNVERALRDSEQRLRDILDRSPFAVFLKGRDGRYVFANTEALRIMGRHADEVIGSTDFDVLPMVAHELRERDQRVWQSDAPQTVEQKIPSDLGGMRTYQVNKFLLRDSAGTPYALCGIATDITDRLRDEEILRDSDRRKDEFIAILAHELRNPLSPIRHAVKVAGMPNATAEHLRWSHDVIDRQVHHMARLLDDLLDISRITSGKLELRKERVNLADIIANAVETARPLLESKQHQLKIGNPVGPIALDADPIRLAQIFSNLLTNAAKYTDLGGLVELGVTTTDGRVIVRVKDNGIGISSAVLPRLFQMFSQAELAIDRSEGGLGIGLALVRGLVELHGGTIEAHSEGVGKGSSFSVTLPLPPVVQATKSSRTLTRTVENENVPLKILIADDNVDSLDTLGVLLEMSGYEVHTAVNGREALSVAQHLHPDVAVVDIGMPELNGYEVAERIRREQWAERLLLIACSGWGQEQDKRQALTAGFDHHFTKPLDVAILIALLNRQHPRTADSNR